jgi:hypothetical protein
MVGKQNENLGILKKFFVLEKLVGRWLLFV